MSSMTTRSNNANNANNGVSTLETGTSSTAEATTATTTNVNSNAAALAAAAAAAAAVTANPDAMNFNVVTGNDIPIIDELVHQNIVACDIRLRALPTRTVESLDLDKIIPERIQELVELHLLDADVPDAANWKSWDYVKKLFPTLKQIILPNNGKMAITPMDHVNLMRKVLNHINLWHLNTLHKVIIMLGELINLPAVKDLSPEQQRPLVARLYQIMHDSKSDNNVSLRMKEKVQEKDPRTLEEFKKVYFQIYMRLRRSVHEAKGLENQSNRHENRDKAHHDQPRAQIKKRPRGDTRADTASTGSDNCTGCGRHHDVNTCMLREHPDFNKEATPWVNSTKGKAWAAKQGRPVEHLPWKATLSGQPWSAPELPAKSGNNKPGNNHNNKRGRH